MRNPLYTLVPILAVSALALAGCSDSSDDTSAASSSTPASTVVVTSTQAPPSTTTMTATPETSTTETSTTTSADTPPATTEELTYADVGTPVTIAGDPSTVCIYGDGWGTNVWAGNENTSCEFVIATHEALVGGLNATTDNIRDHLPPTISVTSPVTGQNYDLTCVPRGDTLVSCRGGDGASVYFY